MPYLLLIVEPRGQRAAVPQEIAHRRYDAMMEFSGALQREGVLLRAEQRAPLAAAEQLGVAVANALLEQGAADILQAVYGEAGQP